ncbi:MAG: betaine-aldehyde dehydrogenase [Gammaproteobacteria bacterium]|nr:MAG: betaine-aldehyde dehydrogenase [Gammaproteobacteria bacterium]TLZ44935.1 MAG: betaine-aldehyde dehydrogenase [Gammaproteobacteria bacterium]
MNKQSTTLKELVHHGSSAAHDEGEEARRVQLIEVTIDSLAEVGYVGTTLAEIARRAGVSPGLVSHYFGEKDGLLEAAFRTLARTLAVRVRARLAQARTPRARVQAVIDTNLAPEEFDQRTGTAWLAFWGQVLHVRGLKRVQTAYQRRMLSNLRSDLRRMIPGEEARSLAAMIAAMIDGVWLRAALSEWQEADSEAARALLTAFVEGRLRELAQAETERANARATAQTCRAGDTLRAINPATGALLAELAPDGAEQVDAAVARARAAQREWAALTGAERGRILQRAARVLRERNDELAELETRNTGKPIQETRSVDVLSGAECLEYYGGLAAGIAGEHFDLGPRAFGYTRREPHGVVAGIGAWNYPLQIACWKSAPALACGNAMIFKPAELTPLTAIKLAEVYASAGVPEGVFQIVQGRAETGRLLTRHPDIRKISLTGEVGTGKAVLADAAAFLKQVTLELGGKSPLIVFGDASLENAVSGALLGNFYSAGEVCSNGTRVFVHRSLHAAFVERLRARVAAMRVGDPLDPATQVGALISEAHLEKVLGFIARGRAQGARLVTGGARLTAGELAKGCFVAPTVFDDCHDDMDIVRQEIFGPVMSVLEFEDEDEVIARANATDFGLAAGVFTNDLTRAHRVIARLQAGTCWINHYNVTPIELPFGGVKLSGLGRENGRAAIEHYTQLKSVYVAMGDIDAPY